MFDASKLSKPGSRGYKISKSTITKFSPTDVFADSWNSTKSFSFLICFAAPDGCNAMQILLSVRKLIRLRPILYIKNTEKILNFEMNRETVV